VGRSAAAEEQRAYVLGLPHAGEFLGKRVEIFRDLLLSADGNRKITVPALVRAKRNVYVRGARPRPGRFVREWFEDGSGIHGRLGKLMKLELSFILEKCRSFYKEHGLADWAEALPRRGNIAQADESKLVWAERAGWDELFAFPPFGLQMATLDRLIEEMARKHAAPLPDDQQYTEPPFLADETTKTPNGQVLQRTDRLGSRAAGPYLWVFSRVPVTNAWGRSGKQIAELLESKDWQGLTVPEYLVLQRVLSERERHHRFFSAEEEPRGHHLWLVDSATDTRMAIASSNQRGINIQACPLGHREARRATLAGMALAINAL